jgi:hypothetical protein
VIGFFEETGVLVGSPRPLGPDDCLVGLAGLAAFKHFADNLFAVDPHREVADAGARRNGEDVLGFERSRLAVAERLCDGGDCDAMIDVHINLL